MTASNISDIVQIGVVTADVDRAMRVWEERYGVGPWMEMALDQSQWTINGETPSAEWRVVMAQAGSTQIELIQPTKGTSMFSESLARHGGADHVHHVRCKFEEDTRQAVVDDAREKGIPVAITGHNTSGVEMAFLDSEPDLGFMLEFVHVPGQVA
jgi:methylmalonyl-CoA/ethylmalonyl-CoA epimerase